jgi:hypothetical protein
VATSIDSTVPTEVLITRKCRFTPPVPRISGNENRKAVRPLASVQAFWSSRGRRRLFSASSGAVWRQLQTHRALESSPPGHFRFRVADHVIDAFTSHWLFFPQEYDVVESDSARVGTTRPILLCDIIGPIHNWGLRIVRHAVSPSPALVPLKSDNFAAQTGVFCPTRPSSPLRTFLRLAGSVPPGSQRFGPNERRRD